MTLEQRRKEFLELHGNSEEGNGEKPLTPNTESANNKVPGVGGEGTLKKDAATSGVSVTGPNSTAVTGASGCRDSSKLGKSNAGAEKPLGTTMVTRSQEAAKDKAAKKDSSATKSLHLAQKSHHCPLPQYQPKVLV